MHKCIFKIQIALKLSISINKYETNGKMMLTAYFETAVKIVISHNIEDMNFVFHKFKCI